MMRRFAILLVTALLVPGSHSAFAAEPTAAEMISACETYAISSQNLTTQTVEAVQSATTFGTTLPLFSELAGITNFTIIVTDGSGQISFNCAYDKISNTVSTFSGS